MNGALGAVLRHGCGMTLVVGCKLQCPGSGAIVVLTLMDRLLAQFVAWALRIHGCGTIVQIALQPDSHNCLAPLYLALHMLVCAIIICHRCTVLPPGPVTVLLDCGPLSYYTGSHGVLESYFISTHTLSLWCARSLARGYHILRPTAPPRAPCCCCTPPPMPP